MLNQNSYLTIHALGANADTLLQFLYNPNRKSTVELGRDIFSVVAIYMIVLALFKEGTNNVKIFVRLIKPMSFVY